MISSRLLRLRPFFYAAAGVCAALVAPLAVHGETVDQIQRNFTVAAGGTLEVAIDEGGIEVTAGDANVVAIDIERRIDAGSKEKEAAYLRDRPVTIEQDGDTIRIRTRSSNGGSFWKSLLGQRTRSRINYTVRVPQQFNTRLNTAGGGIKVSGLNGEVRAETSGGGLVFAQISGTIAAHTSGGGIQLDSCRGTVEVETSGGGIESKEGAGEFALDTSGGSIRVHGHRGDVKAHTSGGSITAEKIAGVIDADTSGGSIRAALEAQPARECRFESSGGGISLSLPANINVDLDAATSAGSVHSEFAVAGERTTDRSRLRGAINAGGPRLYLRTSAGNIDLRSTAPAAGES